MKVIRPFSTRQLLCISNFDCVMNATVCGVTNMFVMLSQGVKYRKKITANTIHFRK